MPSGGIVGGRIGAIEGAAIGQMRGGQIGGMSSALPHSGCTSPSTHWQAQEASARAHTSAASQMVTLINANTRLIAFPTVCSAAAGRRSQRLPLPQLVAALTFVLVMFS